MRTLALWQGVRELDRDSCSLMVHWFTAFFRRDGRRRRYPPVIRQILQERQGNRCAICNRELQEGHLDHIVPWSYVGDQLEDNLQILCPRCNTRKKVSSFYQLQELFRGSAAG